MYCSNCGEKIEDSSKFCTECGTKFGDSKTKDNTNNNKNPVAGCFSLIGSIVIIIIVFSFIFGSNDNNIQEGQTSKSGLELVDSKACSIGYGAIAICGTIKNTTSKNYSYAQVEINLYDKNNNTIGSTLANINNLEPGSTWKFEAPILENHIASYRIKGITAY